jgi:antitoxin CptB
MSAQLEPEDRRMLWHCRRGMKELDVLLERYVTLHLAAATASQRRLFARLLELPDPVLADYLLGHACPPEADLALLTQLISFGPAPR